MIFWKNFFLALIGLSSGMTIAGGIFAFIAAIGVVPRLAQKTDTLNYISFYEDVILLGGIFGTSTMLINYYIPIGTIMTIIVSACSGIFVGMLAVSLAEVINVMPILMRRTRLKKGISIFVLCFAIGKAIGSIMYFVIPGFYYGS